MLPALIHLFGDRMQLEPIVSFAILLAVILIVPYLFERLRLPGLLGLLVAGVALGPFGLRVLQTESETMKLLSDIGLVYLMFVAGLEIDLDQFRATRNRSMGFGFYTFIVPLITGTIVGRLFGFGWNASILIGSLFASHTLLAYPIISRLGVINNESITVTIGATIFTDIGALLVLAVCVGIHGGNFTALNLATLFIGLALYSAVILFGFNWLGKAFFRRSGDQEGNQFLFILLVVFLASLGAEVIGVEKIVGAFLAGLAVNSAVGESPVKEKVIFVGNVLFIPIFFVDLGLLVNVTGFIDSLSSIWMTLAIVVGLIGSKLGAALLARWTYNYTWTEGITMWSLSMPQVAATLAATLVGYRAGLLTEAVLNSVIVLMIVTSILGPLITARTAIKLIPPTLPLDLNEPPIPSAALPIDKPFTVLVPVYNPRTEQRLLEMAALLARHGRGRIVPLSITPAQLHLDSPELEAALLQSQRLLDRATTLGQSFDVTVEPLSRIDDSIAQGISRASREQNADLVIMGWGRAVGLRARLFGSVIDNVLWASHCPVAVTRLLDSPLNIRRILVPVENLAAPSIRTVQFAEILAAENHAHVTLLHVGDRFDSPSRGSWMQSQLSLLASRSFPEEQYSVKIVSSEDVAGAIAQAAQTVDLVVLRSSRRRQSLGELSLSDLTRDVVGRLTGSIVLLGEPPRYGTILLSRGEQPTAVNPILQNSTSYE